MERAQKVYAMYSNNNGGVVGAYIRFILLGQGWKVGNGSSEIFIFGKCIHIYNTCVVDSD